MIDPERTRILEQIAGSVKNPVFHIGDLRPDTNYLGDSFGAILSRRIPDSLGSGLYMTSNIQDVLEWNTYKTNEYGRTYDIYLYDLGEAKNLKVFTSTDDLDDYTYFMGALTKHVLNGLKFEHYQQKPFSISESEFHTACHNFSQKYKLSEQDVHLWTREQRKRCSQLVQHSDLLEKESIATTFQKEIMEDETNGENSASAPTDDSRD